MYHQGRATPGCLLDASVLLPFPCVLPVAEQGKGPYSFLTGAFPR